jgi:spore coat polysaccharide biosynthesis protein SpsF
MLKTRTIAIIQARYGSSRLPGKVLLDIAGEPMLVRVVERTRRARLLDGFIVATTTEPDADAIETLCRERGYPVYRGSPQDVLDRCYQAARQANAEIIVRITADCPVIDPDLIDETAALVTDHGSLPTDHFDFACNRLPPPWGRTYPIGLDVEACTFAALERAWKEATEPYQREHVLPYLYEGVVFNAESQPLNTVHCSLKTGFTPRGFHVALLDHDPDYGALRWTVDTPEDLELIRQVYARFGGRDNFGWREILALFEREPGLAAINAGIPHKGMLDVDRRV